MSIEVNENSILERLIEIAYPVSAFSINRTATTERTIFAQDLFSKITANASSIAYLIPSEPNTSKRVVMFDVSGMASLTRDLMDSYDILFYLCLEKVPKDESEFRRELYSHHNACEVYKIRAAFDIESSRSDFLEMSKMLLARNPFFTSLKEKQKKHLINGNTPIFSQNIRKSRDYPLEFNCVTGIYKLLSNSLHSTSLGVSTSTAFGSKITLASIDLLLIAVQAANQYFALVIDAYFKLRKIIARMVSEEDRYFVKSICERDLAKMTKEIYGSSSKKEYYQKR